MRYLIGAHILENSDMGEPKLDTVKVTQSLHVQLTEQELADRASGCAKAFKELDAIEDDYREVKKEWSAKIKDKKAEVLKLSRAHVTGREVRQVDCEQVFDLKGKRTWFQYNKERYEERDLTEYEVAGVKQRGLFNDGPNVPGLKLADEPKDGDDKSEHETEPTKTADADLPM